METKRKRRSEDELLADTIAQLYGRIQSKIDGLNVSKVAFDNEQKENRIVLEEIFEALAPLKSLEDQYRNKYGN